MFILHRIGRGEKGSRKQRQQTTKKPPGKSDRAKKKSEMSVCASDDRRNHERSQVCVWMCNKIVLCAPQPASPPGSIGRLKSAGR